MTTTTQTNGNGTTALVKHEERPPAQMMTWTEMHSMGDQLVRTGFLPDHIKNGAQAAAIIMTGRELGMEPMRALRSLFMVKGKVVEDASSQLARFKSSGGHAKFTHLDEKRATLVLRHPNGDEHTETFTIDDAKAARLSGDNWQKYPKAMLRSRCITAGLKSIGWEGGVGAYDPDEAVSFSPVETVTVTSTTATTARAPDDLTSVKTAVRDELRRLKVGAGMSAEDEKKAHVGAITRVCNGVLPTTLEQWRDALSTLSEEPTPETHVVREPGSDDDRDDSAD
jgi:hypothetical protein